MKIERVNKIANSMKDSEEKVSVNALIERLNSVSFWELLTDTVKIEIPIIQRDYAQGREDKKTEKIRASFVDSIINAIESEENSLELDFVYGDINNGIFQPLDGQQRLTTLFLLHWYLANITDNLTETKHHFKKFTYETRISSREFCNELVEKGQNLGKGETIREQIVDSSWFFLSWKNDPTIKAMLVMLDSIEERLKDKNKEELRNYWQKLISENPPITFHFKQLNDIGLTDDLYIKMNARGKPLTDFENFKAHFEKHIKGGNEEEKDWEEDVRKKPKNSFSHRIDTIWTDLFWKHKGEKYNVIDYEIINFIAGIAILNYALSSEISNRINTENENESKSLGKIKDKRIQQRIQQLANEPIDVWPDDFYNKQSFEYLKECLQIYAIKDKNNHFINDEIYPDNLTLWDYCDSNSSLFKKFIEDKNKGKEAPYSGPSYKQRILFYAQTQYLLTVESFNSIFFADWMRVVRNIVQNATIYSAEAFIGAISLIKELSTKNETSSLGCENIYEFLNKNSIKSEFASKQVKEEIAKAKIITTVPDAKSVIHKTEDTNFCKGKIRFPFYCIDYDIENGYSNQFDINKLKKVLSVIDANFTDLKEKLSDDFKRAFLTIEGNNYFDVWPKWSNSFGCHKRWLLNTVGDLKNNFSERSGWKRDYLKDLFLKLEDKSLNEIIAKYTCPQNMPNWEKRLIKEPGLLNGATFILISDFNNSPDAYCKIAWQQRPSREDQVTKIQ